MAVIVEQEVSETRLYIRAADGKTVEIFPTEVLNYFNSISGDEATRRILTRDYIKNKCVTTLTISNISFYEIDVDFDISTGQITQFATGDINS